MYVAPAARQRRERELANIKVNAPGKICVGTSIRRAACRALVYRTSYILQETTNKPTFFLPNLAETAFLYLGFITSMRVCVVACFLFPWPVRGQIHTYSSSIQVYIPNIYIPHSTLSLHTPDACMRGRALFNTKRRDATSAGLVCSCQVCVAGQHGKIRHIIQYYLINV